MRLMTKNLCLGVVLASLCGTASANEQNNTIFIGASASYIMSDSIAADVSEVDTLDFPAVEFVVGYKFNQFLGLDLRYGTGLNTESVAALETETPETLEFTIEGYQSAYFRPEISNREAKLYFLIGYAQVNLGLDALDANDNLISSNSTSESGLSYGLGAGWFVEDNMNVNLEYRMLLDDDDNEFAVVTMGLDYRFRL